MPPLTINADEIAAALREHVEIVHAQSRGRRRSGAVLEVGDGIARVAGLPDIAVNELLEFDGGTLGLALNLDEDSIGAVVLGQVDDVEEGEAVKATGRILSVPVGDGTDRPGREPARPAHRRQRARSRPRANAASRSRRPASSCRKPVHEPLQTGIKAIDAMTPIGRGQRELIIGDRKTGKTTVAIDTILNQQRRRA